ncbi:MAG: hypothetical protein ACPL4I_12125 [Bacteroidota bacterium]
MNGLEISGKNSEDTKEARRETKAMFTSGAKRGRILPLVVMALAGVGVLSFGRDTEPTVEELLPVARAP